MNIYVYIFNKYHKQTIINVHDLINKNSHSLCGLQHNLCNNCMVQLCVYIYMHTVECTPAHSAWRYDFVTRMCFLKKIKINSKYKNHFAEWILFQFYIFYVKYVCIYIFGYKLWYIEWMKFCLIRGFYRIHCHTENAFYSQA